MDWADLMARVGLILLGLAIYKVAEMIGVTFYMGALLVTISVIISYKQSRGTGGS